ncbi:MAG: FAD-dependent oxidoreductase, partial [Sulfurimicrobium sp.]|nr:FAD-dependent oxidoreductase [Sulfurimicrobium sp.]
MSKIIEVCVPDIGDFNNVPVIEVLVKAGDKVEKDASLVTLESEKSTMEIPSSHAGTVKSIKLKVGDKVIKGSEILTLEVEDAPTAPAAPETPSPVPAVEQTAVAPMAGGQHIHADVVVLGAGPGGYTAAFRAADLGKKVVLVERHASLGGVCLNVGCIPSKALLHVAKVISEAAEVGAHGVKFGKPEVDIDQVRGWKENVVGRLTGGLSQLAKQRNVLVIRGRGQFISPHHIKVETAEGEMDVSFDSAVIAAGSQVVNIPVFPEDPRIMDSTGALALAEVPKRMLVIGGGIIGLEMATVYHALGSKIT